MPARPAGCYRLRQRAGSADLNHMIDTASVRHILGLLAPVRHGLVINDGRLRASGTLAMLGYAYEEVLSKNYTARRGHFSGLKMSQTLRL